MINQNPIFVLRRLIKEELNLLDTQVLINSITNDYLVSNASNLFVVIYFERMQTISTENKSGEIANIFYEQKQIWKQSTYNIEFMSKNLDAFDVVDTLPLVFISTKKRQLCEQYKIKIHDHLATDIMDISAVEGGSILKRFKTSVNVLHQYNNKKQVDYYDTFSTTTIFEK